MLANPWACETSTKFLARQTFGWANLRTNETYPWSVVLLEVGYILLGTKGFIVVVVVDFIDDASMVISNVD